MSLEMIELICVAEEEARLTKQLAEQNAQDLMDKAERVGMEKVASTLARAESEIAHLIRVADQKATSEALELASTTANRLATQRARAERRLEIGAELIVERIVNL